jgi:hypothetical protein
MALYSVNEKGYEYEKMRKENPSHIRRVSCDVVKCVYHDGDSFCTASKITVGPSFADRMNQTACSTFRERGSVE